MGLSLIERIAFRESLEHPGLFRYAVRPALYRRCEKDPERVHEYVMQLLNDRSLINILAGSDYLFDASALNIKLNGKSVRPIGTAAGVDKNGDALEPFSYIYGFQEPGTVIIPKRDGNKRPRVAIDNPKMDAYNAQGFPSRGKDYFLGKIAPFRDIKPDYPVYASICGLPLSQDNAIDDAMMELKTLLDELNPYVNGFVWNPFSPNTDALKLLRTPQIFRESAELMRKHAPKKLRLVKMGPYEHETRERTQFLSLVNGFLEGGGHGIVAVNTKMVPREQVPSANWGYPLAGRSGAFLKEYRLRAVEETRKTFLEAVIFATGGIFDGDDAYETFLAGATCLESYTPETFYGPGLIARKQERIIKRLQEDGYFNLQELQEEIRGNKLLCDIT